MIDIRDTTAQPISHKAGLVDPQLFAIVAQIMGDNPPNVALAIL